MPITALQGTGCLVTPVQVSCSSSAFSGKSLFDSTTRQRRASHSLWSSEKERLSPMGESAFWNSLLSIPKWIARPKPCHRLNKTFHLRRSLLIPGSGVNRLLICTEQNWQSKRLCQFRPSTYGLPDKLAPHQPPDPMTTREAVRCTATSGVRHNNETGHVCDRCS